MTGLELSKCAKDRALTIVATLIVRDSRESGVLPSVSLAQTILETGWWKSKLCTEANALFGIKAGKTWTGKVYDTTTKEVYANVEYTVNAAFRAYSCISDSIADHSKYLTTAMNGSELRYKGLTETSDYKEACQIIYDGGYATDPSYVSKLCRIIEENNLTKYDTGFTPVSTEVVSVGLNIQKKTSTSYNTTVANGRSIKYIVLHYTAGTTSKSGAAMSNASYFCACNRGASADFFVDDANIVQFNPDIKNRYTWAVGDGSSGAFGGVCSNRNSISIEICSNNKTGKVTTAGDANWYFTDAELALTWDLVKYLCKEYSIPYTNVITHYLRSKKTCPGVVGWFGTDQSKYTAFKTSLNQTTNPYSGTTSTTTTTTVDNSNAAKYVEKYVKVSALSDQDVYADIAETVKVGSIDKGDVIYIYSVYQEHYAIMYQTATSWKLGWIPQDGRYK